MVERVGAAHYEVITWNEAFRLIAAELNALPTPNAAAFYTSGRTSNKAAFLYQLFVRQFGTNNLPDCSNMCHESSGEALQVAPYSLPRGCTATYFPEANVLLPINSVAERSNTPTSKFVVVSIAPSPNAEAVGQSLTVAKETSKA